MCTNRLFLACLALALIILAPADKNGVPVQGIERLTAPNAVSVTLPTRCLLDPSRRLWAPIPEQLLPLLLEPLPQDDYRVIDKISIVCGELLESPKPDSRVTLATITAGTESIPIISFRGLPYPYYSNTIYIHHSNVASLRDLDRMVEVNKSFIAALGPKLFDEPIYNNARFVTVAKSPAGEFATIFEVKGGKFGAIALKLETPAPHCKKPGGTMADALDDALGPWLAPIAGKGRLYLIGDDLDRIDPTELARRFNCDVIRRGSRSTKSLKDTEVRLAELQGRRLEAAKTIYINGLPRDEAEAVRSGYQRNEVGGLQRAGAEMDGIAKQFFNQARLSSSLPTDL